VADFSAEDRALLDAVRAAPDDDGPRLVAADAWDDRGDPRGRFVRVQLALATLPPYDPRRPDLAAEERALLARHGDEWSAPLAGLASGVAYRRGFVHALNLTARQFFAHADRVFEAVPVRHLRLLDAGRSLTRVFASPFLTRLNALTVFAQYLGGPGGLAAALRGAPSLAGLTRLSLGRNRLTDDDVAELVRCPFADRLESLDLHDNPITDAGVARLGEPGAFPRLARLDLGRTGVGPTVAAAVATAPHRPTLQSLGLAGNVAVGRLSSDAVRLLDVAVLDVSETGLTVLGLNRLVAASERATVRVLRANGNSFGDGGAGVVATSPAFVELRDLGLRHNEVTAEGAERLATSPVLGRLERLDLTHNPIEPLGWGAFLSPPGLRRLKRLDLPEAGLARRLRDALEGKYPAGPAPAGADD
jgi:uncharacterized protein (TIGR02996 family)